MEPEKKIEFHACNPEKNQVPNPNITISLLICTLISENQGLVEPLKKFRSCKPELSPVLHLKKLDLYLNHTPEKNPGDKLKKKSGVKDLKFF